MKTNLEALKNTIPFKWRVQSTIKNGASAKVRMIAYVDARDVQEALDNAVGVGNWQDEYYSVKNTLFCKIGILVDGQWCWKSDAGTESNVEKLKGEASDAFKRAGVKWGINRDAYLVGTVDLPTKEFNNKFYPCDKNGKFLKGQELNDVCNSIAKIEDLPNYYVEDKTTIKELA